jgi:hypothetical protein
MIVFESRACGVLHNLLCSLADQGPFLLPANVCPVVPLTFRAARQRFRLVDIAPGDLALQRDTCLDLVARDTSGVAGVLFVRAYGAETEVETFFRELKRLRPGLLLIDDRGLCRPDWDGHRVTDSADVTLFSTGSRKCVDLGFGGFAHIKAHVPYREHERPFRPEALEDITRRYRAAVSRGVPFDGGEEDWLDLRRPPASWEEYRRRAHRLGPIDEHRQRVNTIYSQRLPREVQLPAVFQNWRFNILVDRSEELVARLQAAGLFASRHYDALGGIFGPGSFPNAEALHRRVVNLFNDRHIDEENAERVTVEVLRHLDGTT